MNKIKAKMTVDMTAEEVTYVNELIERDTAIEGVPHEDYSNLNKCPLCGETFGGYDRFCSRCGHRLKFVTSDVVPL